MTTKLMSRRWILAVAAYAMPLAGCSLLPDPPASQIYRLSPTSDDPPDGRLLHSQLVVDLPTAPRSLDTDRIALMRGRTEFDYYADSTWTDRLPALLQNRLVEAFESNGSIADVVREPDTLGAGFLLETDILEFEARYTGSAEAPPTIVVSFSLRLVKTPDRRTIAHTLITGQAPATRNKLDGIVMAFDAATGEALDRSVAWTIGKISQS
jgi:cholesterol transport system auxiliary component